MEIDNNLNAMANLASTKGKKKSPVFDVAIVGAGLGGLLLAKALTKLNYKIALIDKAGVLGGTCRSKESLWESSGLSFLPFASENKDLLTWFENILESKLTSEVQDTSPSTFQGGQLKPFLGFGDQKFDSANELAYFNSEQELSLAPGSEKWVELLSKDLSATVFLNSEVTDFTGSTGKREIASLTINGTKQLRARQFVLSCQPQLLLEFCPPEFLASGFQKKLTKLIPWTSLELSFFHRDSDFQQCLALTDGPTKSPLFFLTGSNNDFQPCVGRYFTYPSNDPMSPAVEDFSNHTGSYLSSKWLTLLASDAAESEETLGAAIRNMKRQIKRAWGPAFFDSTLKEKITVSADSFGDIPPSLRVTGITNLTLATQGLASQANLWGTIEACKSALDDITTELEKTAFPVATEGPSAEL